MKDTETHLLTVRVTARSGFRGGSGQEHERLLQRICDEVISSLADCGAEVEIVAARPETFLTHCARCGDPAALVHDVEVQHRYRLLGVQGRRAARARIRGRRPAETEACQRGDYNFPGVGLSQADRDFLWARLIERRWRQQGS